MLKRESPPVMGTFTDDWLAALQTTFALMAVSSIVAIGIGIPAAACAGLLAQCRVRGVWLARAKRMLVSVWVIGMLFSASLPLILHAAVWESTAGKFGWLMKTMTGGNLLWVGWIHGVHGAAIVAVATFWGSRNIAPEVLQHAVLDFNSVSRWFRVQLPIARPVVATSLVIVCLLAATEMSVVNLHSVRTVADQFYLYYSLDPDWTAIAVTTWLPLLIGIAPAWMWWKMRRSELHVGARVIPRQSPFDALDGDQTARRQGPPSGGVGLFLAVTGTLASMIICQAAIVLGLLMQAGHTVRLERGVPQASWSLRSCLDAISSAPSLFAEEYAWTLQLAVLTSLAVTPIAWVLARLGRAAIHPCWKKTGSLIDCLMMIAFLIPGPVVGLAIVRLFASGIPGGEVLATQTLIPTMMAVGVRSGVIAYVVMRVGYHQISDSVWRSARIDCGLATRVLRIELPLLFPSVLVALIAAAVVASGDVPAALPVLPPGVTTVGTRLFGLLHSGSRYQEASLAFWYLVAISGIGLIAWRISIRAMSRRFRRPKC